MDTKEAIQSVEAMLTGFLKSGPEPSNHPEEIQARVLEIICSTIMSPAESTENYRKRCDDFLQRVIEAKGLPIRGVLNADGVNLSSAVNPNSSRGVENSAIPLPEILSRYNSCIENYGRQSKLYLDGEIAEFRRMLWSFIEQVPVGGSTDRLEKRRITEIKKKFGDLIKWDRLFSTIKAASFPTAIRRTFELEGSPLAAIWHYSPSDEQGEFRNAYNHRDMDGRIYAVRGNWAIDKGLMKPGANGYIDEINQPGEDFDCRCHYQWLYSLGRLPVDMLTAKGQAELKRVRAELAGLVTKPQNGQQPTKPEPSIVVTGERGQPRKPEKTTATEVDQGGIIRRIMGWLGRGGS
jgi:hypothetical protein